MIWRVIYLSYLIRMRWLHGSQESAEANLLIEDLEHLFRSKLLMIRAADPFTR